MTNIPKNMEVRGAHVHNPENIGVDIPLHEIVGIAGVSGSGKSSLALGVLYAEGSRRFLESLSFGKKPCTLMSGIIQVIHSVPV